MLRSFSIVISLVLLFATAEAQDSTLLNMISDSMQVHRAPLYVTGTFKGVHVINMQTGEAPAKGALNFIIMHRFGKLNDGAYNFFGLDNATIRLGLDYGITDRLSIGAGRSSYVKTFDAYAKYKVLRQSDGSSAVPLGATVLVGVTNYTQRFSDKNYLNTKYRAAYFTQLLLARKFNSNVSVLVVPTWLHYNLVPSAKDKNDVFAAGIGGRLRIKKRMSINAEYNFVPAGQIQSFSRYNSFSTGLDIETGGHVFQLVFTNSAAMTEPQYIGQTMGTWRKGDIYFGFNVSRIFSITRSAKRKAVY